MRKIQNGIACVLVASFTLGIVMGSGHTSAQAPDNPVSKSEPRWVKKPEGYLKKQNLSPEDYEVAVGSAMARDHKSTFPKSWPR